MDNTGRFTGKAGTYDAFRPGYPVDCLDYLFDGGGLKAGAVAADVGAGTGIFSRLLAERGAKVICVEPNDDMRRLCRRRLEGFDCEITATTAEETGLESDCADAVTVAQAFHWFDRRRFRDECARILRPGGRVILIWNTGDMDKINGELRLLREKYCPAFAGRVAKAVKDPAELSDFYKFGVCVSRVFRNDYTADRERFVGRWTSSSYAPDESDANYAPFVEGLNDLFDRHAGENGTITVPEVTRVFSGGIQKREDVNETYLNKRA